MWFIVIILCLLNCVSDTIQVTEDRTFGVQNIKLKIYISIILPVVLYGCETWSLTFRQKRRVFENRVLRRIF